MKTLPPIAAGDSFAFAVEVTDDTGNPVALSAASAYIVSTSGCFQCALTWTPDPTFNHKGQFSAPLGTAAWPVTGIDTAKPLTIYQRFTYADGSYESAEPISLTVQPGVPNA